VTRHSAIDAAWLGMDRPTTPMSVDDVKQIGRPTDAIVNDVALAAPRRQFCAEVY
jgi:hypothetical protein